MNYKRAELREKLAAAYVLGSLKGRARERFEKLMAYDFSVRREVAEWEARLAPLNAALTPIMPPRRVWRGVRARIQALRFQRSCSRKG